jgi:hypothetical protein
MFEVAKDKGLADDMESYLMRMGDRQDLRFNLTDIPDEILEFEVSRHLIRISDKLGLQLGKDRLLKTFTFMTSRSSLEE